MRTKLITATILLVVGCGGYDTPTAVRPRLVEKSVESLHCTDEGPTDPGCPVLFLAGEYQDEMASAIGTADGLEPLWSGEPSSSVPGPYSCPQLVSFARNIVYIPQYGEDAVFLVDNLNKISDDGYSSLGEPMATYAVGPRTFNSVSPWQKYTMRGGTMRARCQVKTVRTGIGYRVILGPIIWYDYTGEIDLASNDGTFGGQSRGWSYSNNGLVTGAGGGNDGTTPQSVIDKFLAGGNDRCTVGWEIWVDGMRKCDAEGNYFS